MTGSADEVQLSTLEEPIPHRDAVDRLARVLKVEERGEERAVALPIEVLGLEHVPDVAEDARVEEHGPDDGLLGHVIVGDVAARGARRASRE